LVIFEVISLKPQAYSRLFGFSPEGGISLPVCVSHRIAAHPPIPIARRAGSRRLQKVDGREWIVEKSNAVDFD
jgi:hypothetical protein